jgi:hypothetical protein
MNRRLSNRLVLAAALSAAALVTAPAAWLAGAEPASPGSPAASPAAARADRRPRAGARQAGDDQPRKAPNADSDSAADSGAGARVDRSVPPYFGQPWGPRERALAPGEWADIAEFMGKYMPWRIGEVQQMPDGLWKEKVQRLLGVRYRSLRALQNRDPDSFEQRLNQLKVEDQVYKLVSEWATADPGRKQKIREELRTLVASLVDVDLSERRRRVERMEDELRRQKELLDRDTAERGSIVDRRLGRFLDWGNRWPAARANAGKADVNAKPGAKPGGKPAKRKQPAAQGPLGAGTEDPDAGGDKGPADVDPDDGN